MAEGQARRAWVRKDAWTGAALPGSFGRNGEPGVLVTLLSPRVTASIALLGARADDTALALGEEFGLAWPRRPVHVHGPKLALIGTGPGQCLAVADDAATLDALRRSLSDRALVSDQGDGRALLRLGGPRARDLLAKGCPIDLDPLAFPDGAAATTLFGGIGVQLWRIGDEFEIAVGRSFAKSFWTQLLPLALEFGIRVDDADG